VAQNKTYMAKTPHRVVEALYDLETGTTLVRHPEKENAWVQVSIFDDVLKGCPIASMSGEDDYEILAQKSVGRHASIPQRSKKLRLEVTVAGHQGPFSR
jgi:hypothetical protein